MIANWIHIFLVHVAVFGTPWMAYRVLRYRRAPLDSGPWKITFTALIALAIITGISYFTGPETADGLKRTLQPYPQDIVEEHALWGRIGMVVQVITGILGIMGWSSILQEEQPDGRISILLTILLIINTLVMFYTANLGGLIRRMDLAF